MEAVDTRGIEDLGELLGNLLEQFPHKRRELHQRLAETGKRQVDAAIAGAALNDSNGNVRRYQMAHVGKGGGYAAIRPAGSKDGAQTGPNGPGAITNYLENGHRIAPSRGGTKYKARIRVAYVNGYHFYRTAGSAFEAEAIREAEAMAEELAALVEGGT